MRQQQRAFTLIELMVALAVLALVLGFVINSFNGMLTRQRLQAAGENLYDMLLLARTESIARNSNVYVSIVEGSSWCYGIDDTAACNCSTANDCQVNGINKVVSGSDFKNITLSDDDSLGGLRYNSHRGLPETTAGGVLTESSFTFSNPDDYELTVVINPVGRLSLCSDSDPKFRGYQSC